MSRSNMRRRDFLRIGLLSGAVSALPVPTGRSKASERTDFPVQKQPNFVVFVADDAGWHDVGYHGSEIETPNIDRLAREGAELDQFYVWPTCSPTRASLLTGRPASRFGILGPIGGRSTQALPRDTLTLPAFLGRNGYQTALIGKWHLGLRPEVGPRKYGFEYTYGYLHGQIDQYAHRYKNGDRTWFRNDEFVDEEGHATDLIAREAVGFIREVRDRTRPFFLYIAFSVPHYPLQEEARWVSRYKEKIADPSRRLFAASMTHMDDAIGRVLEALNQESLTGSTLVLFLSDNGAQKSWTPHGEYQNRYGPYDRLGDNRPLRGWKGELYEGGVRVPAVACWPGVLERRKVREPISTIDVFPTLAGFASERLDGKSGIEGMDVWSQLTGGMYSSVERVFYWRTRRALAVRVGRWKLIHHAARVDVQGLDELFDLEADPLEKRNLAPKRPSKVKELLEVLTEMSRRDALPG
ncbi:MAG: sulfatase-like hydrolase/transferase [Calditrichaeota bacterium]|nr:sulfatase-like hydrolase/transferase [Calditrichota bacterium]